MNIVSYCPNFLLGIKFFACYNERPHALPLDSSIFVKVNETFTLRLQPITLPLATNYNIYYV